MPTKQRLIMHVDFNAYFASVEQQANPFLRGKAIGVGGKPGHRSVVTTASYTAKDQGVKTAMSSWEALKICPSLEMVDGDPRKYSEMTDRMLNIMHRYASHVSQTSIDEAYLDVTHQAEDWLGAISVALNIKNDLATEIGPYVTVSIGIATNAIMAKIAGGSEKPNGLTVVRPEEHEAFLDNIALIDIPGIGPGILRRLEELGIRSVEQLRNVSPPYLATHFKQYGPFLYNAARGLGASQLDPEPELPKSIGHCYTLPYDIYNPLLVRGTFIRLCERVGYRLRKHGLTARSFAVIHRSDTLRFSSQHGRFDAPTQDGLLFYEMGWPHITRYLSKHRMRLVGIRATDLVPAHEQVSTNKIERKRAQLLPALDKLRNKFGKNAWTRAAAMRSQLLERSSGWHFDHKI